MTVLVGVDERSAIHGALGITVDLQAGEASFCRGIPYPALVQGIWGEGLPIMGKWDIQGAHEPMFGGELFEKIIVNPRAVPLGFVLTGSTSPIEVWNTYSGEEKSLTSATVSGPGGVVVSGPQSMVYGPGQAQAYAASVGLTGTPAVNSTITWTFAGESGADTLVTGARLVVFCPPCDWSQPYEETTSWKTSVLESYSGAEQRIGLRQLPRYEISFRVLSLNEGNTMEMEALIYGWQANTYGVPMWPEYSPLLAEAVVGSQTLSVSTLDRPAFVSGGFAMVWTSMQTWEAFGLGTVDAGAITIDAPLVSTWPAGARVVPLRLGHLSSNQALGRPTNWLTDGTFTFTCEAV
jgi:hypothetical protein